MTLAEAIIAHLLHQDNTSAVQHPEVVLTPAQNEAISAANSFVDSSEVGSCLEFDTAAIRVDRTLGAGVTMDFVCNQLILMEHAHLTANRDCRFEVNHKPTHNRIRNRI